MRVILVALLLLSMLAQTSVAETTGTINNSGNAIRNITSVTGLFGYTVSACSSNASCFGYTCFFDFDAVGTVTTSAGLCNATAVASCIHDDSSSSFSPATASGSNFCVTNTTYSTCTSGVWSNATSCSSGQTCSGGACSAPSSSSSSSGGGGSSAAAKNITLKIINMPTEISIVQGAKGNFSVNVKNDGNVLTQNITLSVSGITWATTAPSIYSVISAGNSKQFNVTINVPGSAEIKTYTVTLTATSTNTTASANFVLKVLPSSSSSSEINQTQLNYVSIIDGLKANLSAMEAQGATKSQVEDIKNILSSATSKVNQAGESVAGNDYFAANTLLGEAARLIDEARNKIRDIGFGEPSEPQQPLDIVPILIVVAVVAVIAAIVLYLFWPTKNQKPLITFKPTK